MSNNVIIKKDNPRAFSIPCTIGVYLFSKELCDLGASIKLMPLAIFKRLGLDALNPITMRLLMADWPIKRLIGVLYDILVKLDKFIFFDDFVVLDCEIDVEILIILERPFLATKRALVDDESGELKFGVNNKEVNFNVCKSMKHPCDMHVVSYVDVIDDDVASVSEITCHGELLAVVLLNYDGEEICDYDEVVVALVGSGSFPSNPKKLVIDFKNRKSPSIEEPPRLKLKALPSHLRYVFLGGKNTLLVIVANDLSEERVDALIGVLKRFIKA
ncbi:uncharacterized protein LOC125863801 [Solanum stenotomum]|uniref:uncharacterized protein LOC125863801 n=1 Tax=Solanum stenotomum TaxID=172797 RepID=UPI0020D19D30|nr:uncharacterized protein LOC125863801 [Solanum stenotomum]